MSSYGEDAASGSLVPQVQTSRLALFSLFSGMVCIPGLSGFLGVCLGLMALRQISRSQYIVGANLAWMGILSGVINLLGWGAVASRYVTVRNQADAPVSAFMTAWAKSEADGEAAAGPGLAPLMHRGGGQELRAELLKRLGPFRDVGARTDYSYGVKRQGFSVHEEISATFPVAFQSGAPVQGEFELGYTGSDLRVIGYRFTSPVLVDLEREKATEAHGAATPEISEFGSGFPKPDPKQMRSFSKH